jgi:ubiquinone/menaquinone biosynthesis C-methylase UbiE
MVEVARSRVGDLDGARYELGDASALPLDDGSVHGYRAERVFQHLEDPACALREARRVLAPGGRVVLQDQDWDAFLLDATDVALGRRVLRAFADSLIAGTVGRSFHALLVDAGFQDVRVEGHVHTTSDHDAYGWLVDIAARAARAGGVADDDVERWVDDQRARAAAGRWWMGMTHFIASARTP